MRIHRPAYQGSPTLTGCQHTAKVWHSDCQGCRARMRDGLTNADASNGSNAYGWQTSTRGHADERGAVMDTGADVQTLTPRAVATDPDRLSYSLVTFDGFTIADSHADAYGRVTRTVPKIRRTTTGQPLGTDDDRTEPYRERTVQTNGQASYWRPTSLLAIDLGPCVALERRNGQQASWRYADELNNDRETTNNRESASRRYVNWWRATLTAVGELAQALTMTSDGWQFPNVKPKNVPAAQTNRARRLARALGFNVPRKSDAPVQRAYVPVRRALGLSGSHNIAEGYVLSVLADGRITLGLSGGATFATSRNVPPSIDAGAMFVSRALKAHAKVRAAALADLVKDASGEHATLRPVIVMAEMD